jgi:hypothetical protein
VAKIAWFYGINNTSVMTKLKEASLSFMLPYPNYGKDKATLVNTYAPSSVKLEL